MNRLSSGLSNGGQFAWTSVLATLQAFWGTNFVYYLIWKNGWLKQYKIQNKDPAGALVKKELTENAIALFTTIPLFGWLFYKLFEIGGTTPPEKNSTDPKKTGTRYGWANCRFSGLKPRAIDCFWQVGAAYLIYDALFYWFHRTLHRPDLYKAIHIVHHRLKTPIGIASSYSQAYESLGQIIMWWLPLGIVGYLGKDLHIFTVYCYSIWRWIETIDAHSGYDIPYHPVKWFLLPAGARFHDFHHSNFDGNYGATKIWDWLMGTNQDYLEHLKKYGTKAK